MNILIIDGQGGKMGKKLVESIKESFPSLNIMAVGTNSTATAAMIKGGAEKAATGENAVAVACRTADVIVGPVGIVIADSLFGELTPGMALSVAQSNATRILIPVNKCDNIIAGVKDLSVTELLEDVIKRLSEIIKKY